MTASQEDPMSVTATPHGSFAHLRDRQVAAIAADRPEHLERRTWDRDRIRRHQREALRDLVRHAVEHSPFHARRLAGVDPDALEPDDLSALPVMTKAEMMAELDDVFCDRRLHRGLVEDTLARTADEPLPILGEHLAFTSGGSSGLRGVFVQDGPANRQFVGSFTRNLLARLHELGGPPPGGLPVAFVGAGCAVHMTGAAPALSATGGIGVRWLGVPVSQPLERIVARLEELQPPALAGYPSMLARLAAERAAGRLTISPVAVTATSELLTAEARRRIREGFGVPVINGFASTEGLVGTSAPDDEAIVFAEDGCIVELVDADGRPVPAGVPASRILVTNLANRVQPLIRYELSDRLVRLPDADDHGYLRALVDGRSDDAFTYGATTVHPLVVRSVLVQEPAIAEYRVTQTPDGVDVEVVTTGPVDRETLGARVAEALARAGVPRPAAAVREVGAIARDPATGKVRRFVPLR